MRAGDRTDPSEIAGAISADTPDDELRDCYAGALRQQQHARAVRIVGKTILRDLRREARDIHTEATDE